MTSTQGSVSRRALLQTAAVATGGLMVGSVGLKSAVAQEETPATGGSMAVGIAASDISGFRTWQASTGTDNGVWSAIFDTLMEYDDSYTIVGGLFDSWESDDAITWNFTVRQGVTWHDGEPLIAQHIIDYFDAVMDPAQGAASEYLATLEGATYTAPDDATVQVVLPAANAALTDDLTTHWLVRVSDLDPASPIGTGAFSFVEWQTNQHVKLQKNPNYWKPGLPYLDELTFRFVPDQDQAINLLTTGEIQVAGSVDFASVGSLSNNPDVQLLEIPEEYRLIFHYLLTKTDAAPWDNPLVRRAVNHAIDREAMLAATLGYGSVRWNPVAEGSWAHNPDAPSYASRDLDTARALMAEAGYAEGETAFSTTLKYWREWSQMPQIAQIIQANLADIGIEVELELLEIGQWVDAISNQLDYEMALTALGPRWDPGDQLGNAYRTDDGAALLWENADFDAAFAAGAATSDQDERAAAYFECQEIALTDCPGTVLNGAPVFAATHSSVRGVRLYNRGYLLLAEAGFAS